MRIFAIIFFVILLLKIKISIYIEQNQFDGIIQIRICFFKVQKKFSIITREKKYIHKKKKKHSFKDIWNKAIKLTEIQKLVANIKIGLAYMPLTINIIPILATLLETLKYQKIREYHYSVLPIFGDSITIQSQIELCIRIRVCDLLYLYVYSTKNK